MKFKTIRDYMNLVDKCQFCGEAMSLELRGLLTPNYRPSYDMDFTNTSWRAYQLPLPGMPGPEEPTGITFTSALENDHLHFCYILNGKSYRVISIDILTNKVVGGNIDRIQKTIWDHKLTIARGCPNLDQHDNKYVSCSSPLLLERRSATILPFWQELEAFEIKLNDKRYMLGSQYSTDRTTLFHLETRAPITTIPLIPLYPFQNKDVIINKIKTVLVFS